MRQVEPFQLQLGKTDIATLQFDPASRDDIPQLLRGLQIIYTDVSTRSQVFKILQTAIPDDVDPENGRPGMYLWKVLVMGALRLNLNCDYDRLLELVNQHQTIRQMLGHGIIDQADPYKLQTIKDNVRLLTPELLDQINKVVVAAGHDAVKKSPDDTLNARCDSFVVETDVHFPTDISLLWDAVRKTVTLLAQLCESTGDTSWRQYNYQLKMLKRRYRKLQKLRHSSSKDPAKKEARHAVIVTACKAYLQKASDLITKAQVTIESTSLGFSAVLKIEEINRFIAHAQRQIDQVKRRIIEGEKIPHSEKVFSVFEEHTEWISKGKAGVPVELGLRTCIVEDQYGFILNHKVMEHETDDQIAEQLIIDTKALYSQLSSCSFDKGFHSPANQKNLQKHLEFVVLPKKGRRNQTEEAHETSKEFRAAKRKHSAVESGINALEVHGLDTCPDHGIEGFKRYVAWAVLARNLQKLGAEAIKTEKSRPNYDPPDFKLAA